MHVVAPTPESERLSWAKTVGCAASTSLELDRTTTRPLSRDVRQDGPANDDPRNVSAGLDARGPQGCAAKSKSVGGPRAEYRVDKTFVATLGQLSAHVAIWRARKVGYLRITSRLYAPEDIVCSEHAVALMNQIHGAVDAAPPDSKDCQQIHKVCLISSVQFCSC